MKSEPYKKTLLCLGLAGLLFSGYLSATKLFSDTCAFGESCPYFLGYPACYYGFGMFLLITIFSFLLFRNKIEIGRGYKFVAKISLLGIIFSGYFTFKELPILLKEGFGAYILGLPTCALGLLFYVAIFVFSVKGFFKRELI